MTEEEELIERLRQSLSDHAASVSTPGDPRTGFPPPALPLAESGFTTQELPLHTGPTALRSSRSRWLTTTAVSAVLVAAVALLFVVLRSPGSTHSVTANVPASPGGGTPVSVATVPTTTPTPATTTFPTTGPPGGPVPMGFTPVSVTFVSAHTGWVMGTAPCARPPCTSVVRTIDGGQTWAGIPAPRTALASDGANAGVSYLRFANLADGWAFGTQVWVTHDGGAHWNEIALPGEAPGDQIMDLETAGGVVYAAVAGDNGMILIDSSPVGVNRWTMSPTEVPVGAGPVPTVQIVLQGGSGWLIENDRTVGGGARLEHGAWVTWQPPCATVEGPALLAASSASNLVAVCDNGLWGGTTTPTEQAYESSDGGTTFHLIASGIAPGQQGVSLIATPPASGTIVIGIPNPSSGSSSLLATFDHGGSWTTVAQSPPSSGNLVELGFTTTAQGVAVWAGNGGAGSSNGTMLMTYNGGLTWSPIAFRPAG